MKNKYNKENMFIILPIEEIQEYLNNNKLKSYRKIHPFYTLDEVQNKLLEIIKNDVKNREYCCVSMELNEGQLILYKNNLTKMNFDNILEKKISIYYLILKENILELISFDFDKNIDYIKLILSFKLKDQIK